LLTSNTIGAVVGVLVAGFVLMPVLGLRAAFALLALLLMAVTAYIALKRSDRLPAGIAFSFLGISTLFAVSTGENWRHVMGSGVFRIRDVYLTQDYWERRKQNTIIHYYKDSADATVSVEQTVGADGKRQQLMLRINGKTDASSHGDLSTQYLLAHLPMAAKPDAKNVFVLGFGSGITGGAILSHPVEKLTIAENCTPVLEAAHFFKDYNRGVLTNSRTIIRNEDARAVLKLSDTKYDIIINEPSNPWVVGVGSVFSKEFYDLCASRVTDDGIVAQWFHSYEMSDYIVMLVVRTFASTFPHMEIWDTQEGDLVLLGSKKPWTSNAAQFQKIFDRPAVREDLKKIQISTAVGLWARQIASQKTAHAIGGDGPIQTDDVPILEYDAPRAFFIGQESRALNFYDERTIQFPLASKDKIAVLRALPDNILMDTFSPSFSSSNPDIRLYLNAVINRARGGFERLDPMGQIIFRPAEMYPVDPPRATNASPEFAECLKLEAQILRDLSNWREPGARLEQILLELIEKNTLRPIDFSPGYYAAMLARCAIGDNDHASAFRLLRLGMLFPQEREQLIFLSRVLDRIIPPELMEEYLRRASERDERLTSQ
jgi:spermidine synthase